MMRQDEERSQVFYRDRIVYNSVGRVGVGATFGLFVQLILTELKNPKIARFCKPSNGREKADSREHLQAIE